MMENTLINSEINTNDNYSECKISNDYYFVKKIKPPKLNVSIYDNYNRILNQIEMSKSKKKKLIIGVIKFKDDENIEYIHCPIVKLNDGISIGVCDHFDSVVNDSNGKKHLASHKYQYHFKYKNNIVKIRLKTCESIEDTLQKYISKELYNNI